jgi:hypothetical protein
MDNLLKQFHRDEHTREAVRTFLNNVLQKKAVERVFGREETKDLADAKDVIDEAFTELHELYADDKEEKVINKAR